MHLKLYENLKWNQNLWRMVLGEDRFNLNSPTNGWYTFENLNSQGKGKQDILPTESFNILLDKYPVIWQI